MRTVFRVHYVESERGWGQNYFHTDFETEAAAQQALSSCNARNTAVLAPDYYIQANKITVENVPDPVTSNTEGLDLVVLRRLLSSGNGLSQETQLSVLDLLTAAQARIAEMEGERNRLRLLILGGEDAPGLAASLSFEQVQRAHQENEANARDRAEYAEARCAEMEEEATYLVDRLNEEEEARPPAYPLGDDEGIFIEVGKLRALRRALTPTSDGERG